MLKYIFLVFYLFFSLTKIFGQDISPKNGVSELTPVYALTNAKIVVSPDQTIERGTLLIKGDEILGVGTTVLIPKEAIKIDLKGYTIYPSFIEIHGTEGLKPLPKQKAVNGPQLENLVDGPVYWNQAVHPEIAAYAFCTDDQFKEKEDYLKAGFGAVSTHVNDGILRGTAVLFNLGESGISENTIRAEAANHFSFSKGSSKQTYPSSQMGVIALIRQFYYDAIWYKNVYKGDANISLLKGIENLKLPQIIEVGDKLEVLRASKIAREFDFDFIVKGNGDEFERIDEIKKTAAKLIVPVNFPEPFDMTDPFLSRFVSLAALKDWELKPYNPYILYKAGVQFALSTHGLKNKSDFLENIRKAIKHGLPKMEALRALTTRPAEFLRVQENMGALEKGKLANFIVVKGDLFVDGEVYENWSNGNRKKFKSITEMDIRGTYNLNINSVVYGLVIEGTLNKPKAEISSYVWKTDSLTGIRKMDTLKLSSEIVQDDKQISLIFKDSNNGFDGIIQLNGTFNKLLGALHGKAFLSNSEWADWSAIRSKEFSENKKEELFVVDTSAINNLLYPNMAYGFDTLPKTGTYFIKNATIWTNEKEGILKEATLLIQDGKIKAVNKAVVQYPNDAVVIDAKGKHVTCGIIDEHSHIAISKGVNEGGQAVSAEVSIADVVRSNDINIYRQLAGGVTASQLLHGSANPIGGQSALIKLKWGFAPAEMLIKDTDGFIKFALGENVKQSNWGDRNVVRFPQTRMGVEQVFYDAFIRAKKYEKEWQNFMELSEKKRANVLMPRKDLELEVLLEILNKKRFISCHSYIQSEINMLMTVADSMGFTVNTFTHILEGYKIADKMKLHGAGASTFADWWAYKFEVNEAIPYNAAILHKMGIVTAINSDDAEMGRRLNHEAAKIVKYGGVSEEDAWKMITLNPAILLHLDERMGSIKEGKDADIVIWSTNPLSIEAKVEKTFVDGILLYDINRSLKFHKRDQLERKRIINLMLEAKDKGAKTRTPYKKENPHYHCDSE